MTEGHGYGGRRVVGTHPREQFVAPGGRERELALCGWSLQRGVRNCVSVGWTSRLHEVVWTEKPTTRTVGHHF